MLNDLASVDGSARKIRLKRYTHPKLLAVDEVGYLRYDTRHADLLYEVLRQRYEAGRPMIVTTNKAFAEWNQVFDSAACVVTLVDRLCHRAEIIELDGESYRKKEAEEHEKERRAKRGSKSGGKPMLHRCPRASTPSNAIGVSRACWPASTIVRREDLRRQPTYAPSVCTQPWNAVRLSYVAPGSRAGGVTSLQFQT